MFAAHFTTEPHRLSIHKNTVAAYIVEPLLGVRDFKVLLKSGKSALKVSSDGPAVEL